MLIFMNAQKGEGKCDFKITGRSLQPQPSDGISAFQQNYFYTFCQGIVLFLFPEASTQFAS